MERKFYNENFESSLKEDADQFKMYPSKKVWHGIYNDVHPGRRWPSIAISFLFIFTLVIVGHLNTANPPGASARVKITKQATQEIQNKTHALENRGGRQQVQGKRGNLPVKGFTLNPPVNDETNELALKTESINQPSDITLSTTTSLVAENKGISYNVLQQEASANHEQKVDNPAVSLTNNESIVDHQAGTISNEIPALSLPGIILPEKKNALDLAVNKAATKTSQENRPQSATVAHNQRKKNNKLSWTIFINPSISHRTYSQKDNYAIINPAVAMMSGTSTPADQVAVERASLGIKSGFSVNYNITKKLKFVAGTQISYSQFNKQASNVHPTIASLILINSVNGTPYSLNSYSNYGNKTGAAEINLHNFSLQASTPIGFQYTLGGNDKMQFDLLTTFQPTYVLLSQAYLLSSNNKYFISEPSLSRKWNMGISIGTMVTFGSELLKWQVGPNIDYQLMSTYDSRYPIKEHFINYGVKLAITKLRK